MDDHETDLCRCFWKYRADKCPRVSHTYSRVYHRLLSPVRGQVRSVLEIGVGNRDLMESHCGKSYVEGASLRAWRDYFPNAVVYGADLLPGVLFADTRIECVQMDQSSVTSVRAAMRCIRERSGGYPRFDLIVDDGSHEFDHMVAAARVLGAHLAPGGSYIIEDVRSRLIGDLLSQRFPHVQVEAVYRGGDEWDNFVLLRAPDGKNSPPRGGLFLASREPKEVRLEHEANGGTNRVTR